MIRISSEVPDVFRRLLRAPLLVALLAIPTARCLANGSFTVGEAGGAVVLPDGRTLIVSVPSEGKLIYFDTVDEKRVKEVEVDFQPGALAAQGGRLLAATKGGSSVHLLDAASGREEKEIKVSGEPVLAMACRPAGGLVYATDQGDDVYAIDLARGQATKTRAKGQLIAVDPTDGKHVYTGIQKSIQEQLVIERGPRGSARISLSSANRKALMLKYAVEGEQLVLKAANDNAADNGRGMDLSPDGKMIAMAGGGGWRSKDARGGPYPIAVFKTDDMQEMVGQIEVGAYPSSVAFHPTLKVGVAFRDGPRPELIVFNSKSLARKQSVKVSSGGQFAFLGFGGEGTKAIYVTLGAGAKKGKAAVEIVQLPLSDQDKEALKKDRPGRP